MTTKQAVIEAIQQLPDESTIEDVMEELYIRQKIERALKQIENGEGIPHEEAKKRLAKWRV